MSKSKKRKNRRHGRIEGRAVCNPHISRFGSDFRDRNPLCERRKQGNNARQYRDKNSLVAHRGDDRLQESAKRTCQRRDKRFDLYVADVFDILRPQRIQRRSVQLDRPYHPPRSRRDKRNNRGESQSPKIIILCLMAQYRCKILQNLQ